MCQCGSSPSPEPVSPAKFPEKNSSNEPQVLTGYDMETLMINDINGNPVKAYLILPADLSKPVPIVIALHGSTSSKHEWLEVDGYTKGGKLAQRLLQHGVAVVAFDWAYHGEHYLSSENVDKEEMMDNNWDDFFEKSMVAFDAVFKYTSENPRFDKNRLGIMSYSMGGIFAFYAANRNPQVKVMANMVLPNRRHLDDEYAPYKNQSNLKNVAVLMVSATKDEYIQISDSKWLFGQLQMPTKKMLSYDSGHSLPIDYVEPAADWLLEHL